MYEIYNGYLMDLIRFSFLESIFTQQYDKINSIKFINELFLIASIRYY